LGGPASRPGYRYLQAARTPADGEARGFEVGDAFEVQGTEVKVIQETFNVRIIGSAWQLSLPTSKNCLSSSIITTSTAILYTLRLLMIRLAPDRMSNTNYGIPTR
jgi:hypothetical protein